MFEDEFSALQADMVDICNEYSKGMADKIFIYAANEGMILAQHFYCISNKIFDCHKLNDTDLQIEFDVSDDCQEQVLDILNEDIQRLQSLCEKYDQPVPKLMKLGMRLYDEFKDNENGLTYTVVLERLEGLTSVGESRLLHTCLDKSWEGITFV